MSPHFPSHHAPCPVTPPPNPWSSTPITPRRRPSGTSCCESSPTHLFAHGIFASPSHRIHHPRDRRQTETPKAADVDKNPATASSTASAAGTRTGLKMRKSWGSGGQVDDGGGESKGGEGEEDASEGHEGGHGQPLGGGGCRSKGSTTDLAG